MSYALGQPVPIATRFVDATGAAVNPTTVTLTVTRPDGTADVFTGGQLTNAQTGTFQLDYPPLASGLHGVRWVAAGTGSSAPKVDSFYVATTAPPLVSLGEARAHLNLTNLDADDQLADFIQVASGLAERYTGRLWRRTVLAETFDGGRDLIRLRPPVQSVTSVTEDGSLLDSGTYTLDARRGWLYRVGGRWSSLTLGNVVVAYIAGPTAGLVPELVRQGVLVQVQHLWETQRGVAAAGRRGPDTEWSPALAYSVPRRVQELWDHERTPLVA